MIKRIGLLFLLSFALFGQEGDILFLPRKGHPFLLNSQAGSIALEESTDMWPRALRLDTDGKGNNVQAVASGLAPFDLSEKQLTLWVKIHNVKELRELWIYAADGSDFANRIVYMPSSDKTQLREGVWTCLRFPLSAGQVWGEPDLSALTAFQFWLSDQGREPVSVQIGPVMLETPSEESAVVITFDDGWKTQLEKAAPYMGERGMAGTAYVISELIGTPGYMTVEDLKTLTGRYGWSLGAHNGERLDGLSREELDTLMKAKQAWYAGQGLEITDFSYPNGAFEGYVLDVVREYFRSGRTIIAYPEANPPADPYLLKVMNIYPPVNFDSLQARLDRMAPKGELLVLVLHKIEQTSAYETEITQGDFEKIIDMVKASDIPVKTMARVSSEFAPAAPFTGDWEQGTVFQPGPAAAGGEGEEKTNLSWADRLSTTGPGHPAAEFNTQLNFSLDWKMAWGEPGYYNQLEDVYLYLQTDISPVTRLYSSLGSSEVNFDDLTRGNLSGDSFHVDSLYMEELFPRDITLTAGYYSPDPHHKWLQVSRSVKLEPAFAQDMTPQYLWIQGTWTGIAPFGAQFAFVPDVIGKSVDGYGGRVLTYDGGTEGTYQLGVPNLFTSFWMDTKWLDAEGAVALNGDAVKVAAEGAINIDLGVVKLAGCLGLKYTHGEEFVTFPSWEHENNTIRFYQGLAGYFTFGEVTFNPGYAYQNKISSSTGVTHLYGMDVGFLYRNMEFYSVVTFFDLLSPTWGGDAGFEIGYSVEYGGVKFVTGYTMGGFSADSGLYGNTSDEGWGVDGPFLRIKATYW